MQTSDIEKTLIQLRNKITRQRLALAVTEAQEAHFNVLLREQAVKDTKAPATK